MGGQKAAGPKVQVGDVGDINGKVNIAGENIYEYVGFTADQVRVLLHQITTTLQVKTFDGRCPYKGLEVFEEEDTEFFFGREKLVQALLDRVKQSRTVFITGPSGSGKSSLVRAGLIPALKDGALEEGHSDRWLYATVSPGRDPLESLALAFSRLKSPELADYFRGQAGSPTALHDCAESVLSERKDQRLVLFIDQFEEVFTQTTGKKAAAFINLLSWAAANDGGRVIVLFAMRSDFLSNCATYPQLNALLSKQFIQIGAMEPDELVSAIAQPALRVGLRIDPDLIAQVINDMHGEPGALPLMQFALKDSFDAQQAQGGMIALTREAYLERGGIHKALERHADDAFAKLSEPEQALARMIFSGLIEVGRGTEDTRRTALFDELTSANTSDGNVRAVVQKLADARLITTDEKDKEETVTLAHEKLIDAWPWLKQLVNESRDVIAMQNEIGNDAREWQRRGRDPSYLYTGARLAGAREQLGSKKLVLSGLGREFIMASNARRQRGRRVVIGVVSAVLALSVLAAFVFRSQAQNNKEIAATAQAASIFAIAQQGTAQANAVEAQKQARISRSGELAAKSVSLIDRYFQASLLMGIEAHRTLDDLETRGALLDNARANPRLLQYLTGHTNEVLSVAFSPDGKTLASASADKTVILWDLATDRPIGEPLKAHTSYVYSVAFSPDGKTLASSSEDRTIILWDVATRRPIGQPLKGHAAGVLSVAFSPDGKMLASSGNDYAVMLWDSATGQRIGQALKGHTSWVNNVIFSPDGKMLASSSGDKTIILWDVATHQQIGQPLRGHTDEVEGIAFSPDGKTLASGSNDKTVILWNVASGEPIGQPLKGHTDQVNGVAFSPDGKTLAAGSADTTIILWDATTRQPIGQPLRGQTDWVGSVAFSPDGKTLASTSTDTTVVLWDLATRQRLAAHTDQVNSVAFSPDGKTLASASNDKTIILWDMATRQPVGQPLAGHTDQVNSVAFSPDGKTLASGSNDKTIILWDVASQRPIGQPLKGHNNKVESVVFSPDGKALASGSADGSIILWDVTTRQPIGQPLYGHSDRVYSVAFSPDGKILASGSADTTCIIWDVATHKQIGQPLNGRVHNDWVLTVAFSPDGKILASGSHSGIILWDVATRKQIGQPLKGHSDTVNGVAFSPDGKTLASGGADNTIILWDAATRQPIGQPLTGHNDWVLSVAFSPDGKTLASGSADKSILLWDASPQSWIERTCQRVGRNFTQAEWQTYFPNEKYRITCPQWPAVP